MVPLARQVLQALLERVAAPPALRDRQALLVWRELPVHPVLPVPRALVELPVLQEQA
jgi:hypothetical protein